MVLLGILGGGVLPGSSNPDPIRPKNVVFHTCFQTWSVINTIFLKSYPFLIHLELK